jgi:hypothetical protein
MFLIILFLLLSHVTRGTISRRRKEREGLYVNIGWTQKEAKKQEFK